MKFYKDPVFLVYLLIYILLSLTALNFNYVEGDDASTLLYHLCGRDSKIQEPYAAYNSGFDFILSILQADEKILRYSSVSLSFLFGFVIMYLLKVLNFNLINLSHKNTLIFYFAIPFIIPDLLFNSLLINPTNISFSFGLLSLITFLNYLKRNNFNYAIISVITFGLSISFRWSMLMMAPVFLGVTIYYHHEALRNIKELIQLTIKTIFFVSTGVIIGLVLIYVTGYSLNNFFEIMLWGRAYNKNAERSFFSMFASSSAFITPSLLFTLLLAIPFLLKKLLLSDTKTYGLIIFGLLSFIPFTILGVHPNLKYSITLLPFLMVLMTTGFIYLNTLKYIKTIWVFSIIMPWVIGINLNLKGSFYGPGFGINNINTNSDIKITENNVDKRLNIKNFTIKKTGGIYMPTPEGPRPLYGYGSVLFGGEWYRQIDILFQERERLMNNIQEYDYKITLFQDRKTAIFQADLYRFGFKTNEPFIEKGKTTKRLFTDGTDSIYLQIIPDYQNKADWIIQKSKLADEPLFFRSSYSSLIQDVLQKTNDVLIIGPYTVKFNAKE
jgi:hypothetical protein